MIFLLHQGTLWKRFLGMISISSDVEDPYLTFDNVNTYSKVDALTSK